MDEPEAELALAVDHWEREGFGPWIVEADGEPVGVFEVHFCAPGVEGIGTDEVEVGWAIAERHRNRGYATAAGRRAIADAFARLDAPWLAAYVRPWNETSKRVAGKLGLRRIGDGRARNGDPVEIWRINRP